MTVEQKIWNRYFINCLFLQTLYMLSFYIVSPIIAQYAVLIGETTTVAGMIAGIFSLCAIVFRPFVGFMADHVNRKRLMISGLIIGSLSILGYGFSITGSMLMFFRITHSLALAIQSTVLSVIAIDFLPRNRIAEGVGYLGITTMIGMSLGPGIGVWLAEWLGHQGAFLSGSVIMALAALASSFLPKLDAVSEFSLKSTRFSLSEFFDLKTIPYAVMIATLAYCAGLTNGFLVLLGAERSIENIAFFFFITALGTTIMRPLAGRITDVHGVTGIAIVGFISEAVVVSVLAYATSLPLVIIASIFRIFGYGTIQSSMLGNVLKDAPDDRRGVVNATFYMGVDVGQGLGSIGGGWVADIADYTCAFLSGLPILAVGLIVFVYVVINKKKASKR